MKINKELIEKYHCDECTPAEVAAVEGWLLSDDSDELPDLPVAEDAKVHKQQMWANIARALPAQNPDKKSIVRAMWLRQFMERVAALRAKNFKLKEAKVNFVVWWRKEGTQHRIMIILPKLTFGKEA